MKYILFIFDKYKPNGGYDDIALLGDSVDMLEKYSHKRVGQYPKDRVYVSQIFDIKQAKLVGEFEYNGK